MKIITTNEWCASVMRMRRSSSTWFILSIIGEHMIHIWLFLRCICVSRNKQTSKTKKDVRMQWKIRNKNDGKSREWNSFNLSSFWHWKFRFRIFTRICHDFFFLLSLHSPFCFVRYSQDTSCFFINEFLRERICAEKCIRRDSETTCLFIDEKNNENKSKEKSRPFIDFFFLCFRVHSRDCKIIQKWVRRKSAKKNWMLSRFLFDHFNDEKWRVWEGEKKRQKKYQFIHIIYTHKIHVLDSIKRSVDVKRITNQKDKTEWTKKNKNKCQITKSACRNEAEKNETKRSMRLPSNDANNNRRSELNNKHTNETKIAEKYR